MRRAHTPPPGSAPPRPQPPHPLPGPQPAAAARNPSPPNTPARTAGTTSRPAARSASSTARSSATMSTIVLQRRHGPPRLTAPRIRRGGPRQQDHHHPVAHRRPTPTRITTQRVADRPRRHHPACRSTAGPWLAPTRLPSAHRRGLLRAPAQPPPRTGAASFRAPAQPPPRTGAASSAHRRAPLRAAKRPPSAAMKADSPATGAGQTPRNRPL